MTAFKPVLNHNGLTLIDGIIGSLAQGGPGKVGYLSCPKKELPFSEKSELWSFFFERSTRRQFKWKVKGESAYDALYLARASLEVLFDSLPKFSHLPLRDQLSLFAAARNWPQHSFVAYAKFFTAYPMARYLHNDPPPVPEGYDDYNSNRLVFVGKAKRMMKNRLVSESLVNARLWTGFLQGIKRGCASVSPGFVYEAMKKHAQKLSKVTDPLPQWYEDRFNNMLDRMFKQYRFDPPSVTLFEPSTSAAFGVKRSEGGARGVIRDGAHPSVIRENSAYDPVNLFDQDHFVRFVETRPGVVEEVRGHLNMNHPSSVLDDCDSYWRRLTCLDLLNTGNLSHVEKDLVLLFQYLNACQRPSVSDSQKHAYGQLLDHMSIEDITRSAYFLKLFPVSHDSSPRDPLNFKGREDENVMVSAVLEPLKVRLITKGPIYRQWFGKFYQKHLWSYLQGMDPFALTGRVLDQSDLHLVHWKTRKLAPQFTKWVSGDYSAATDGLNIRCTKLVFERFLKESYLDDRTNDALRSVLYEQYIHYPPPPKGMVPIPSFWQSNGQLMGSILSFPILCLVNLISYWLALEDYLGREVPLKRLPVLVNGDDILFKTDDIFYEYWMDFISRAGFELSVGKNYVSEKYVTINSQFFRVVEDGDSLKIEEARYLNTGLLIGQSKITGRSSVKELPIWDLYNFTVPDSVNPERTHKRFLHYNMEKIRRYTRNGEYNLFLPHLRGGLGFEPVIDYHITSFQRRLATFLDQKCLEDECRGETPKYRHGLIREDKKQSAPILFHRPDLIERVPTIGPLLESQSLLEDREAFVPILTFNEVDSQLKFQHLRNLGDFRKFPVVRMSDEQLFEQYRLVESRLERISSF